MSASPAQQAETAKRRSQAIALRRAGVDYETIAARLGYASRAAAHVDITRALEANRAELAHSVELLVQEDLDRLDQMQTGFWVRATQGDVRAAEIILKIMERRAKLLRLDVPEQGGVIPVELIAERIRQLSEQLGIPVPERVPLRIGAVGVGAPVDAAGAGEADPGEAPG